MIRVMLGQVRVRVSVTLLVRARVRLLQLRAKCPVNCVDPSS